MELATSTRTSRRWCLGVTLSLSLLGGTEAAAALLFPADLPPGQLPIYFWGAPAGGLNYDGTTDQLTTSGWSFQDGFTSTGDRIQQPPSPATGTLDFEATIDELGNIASSSVTWVGTLPSLGIAAPTTLLTGTIGAFGVGDASAFTGFGGLDPALQMIINVDSAHASLDLGPVLAFQHLAPAISANGAPVINMADFDAFAANPFASDSFRLGFTSVADLFNVPVPTPAPLALMLGALGWFALTRVGRSRGAPGAAASGP